MICKVVEPYLLVLDDYQFISEHAVHETVALPIGSPSFQYAPGHFQRVPIRLCNWGRLRAYDQMLELRTTDLRFTSEEATVFLNEIMRLELSVEVSRLWRLARGLGRRPKMAALS